MSCIVFCVRNYIFICVSRISFVIFHASFALHVNVAHCVFVVVNQCVHFAGRVRLKHVVEECM
jgi:hypothetical protein